MQYHENTFWGNITKTLPIKTLLCAEIWGSTFKILQYNIHTHYKHISHDNEPKRLAREDIPHSKTPQHTTEAMVGIIWDFPGLQQPMQL